MNVRLSSVANIQTLDMISLSAAVFKLAVNEYSKEYSTKKIDLNWKVLFKYIFLCANVHKRI